MLDSAQRLLSPPPPPLEEESLSTNKECVMLPIYRCPIDGKEEPPTFPHFAGNGESGPILSHLQDLGRYLKPLHIDRSLRHSLHIDEVDRRHI